MTAHFAQTAWALAAVLIFVLAAWGMGGFFEKWLRDIDGLLDSECVALRFLAGAGLLGLVTFLIGMFHFSMGSSVVILLAGALLNLRFPWSRHRSLPVSPGLAFAGAVILVCILSGFARPIGDSIADEITYHLLGPKVWLREHRIAPVMEEALTAFPATIEVLYGLVGAISNDRAPGPLGVLFFAAMVLQVRGLARRCGAGLLGGDLAAAFIAGMPAVTSTIENCFVDVPYAVYILAAAR